MQRRINVNGVDYASVEDMPPDVRESYERAMSMLADRDNNGVPDIVEGAGTNVQAEGDGVRNINVTTVTTTNVDVKDWKDLPPNVKEALGEIGKRPGVSLDMNVGFHDRVPRSAEKSRRRGIQTIIVLAIVLAIWGVMWMLGKR